MAAGKRPPIIRQIYYFGSKKVQVGQLKGGVKVSFIAVHARAAAAIGLKLNLPKSVPGTTYSMEHGVIFDNHTTAKGKKVKTPVTARIGSKKITVQYTPTNAKDTQRSLGIKGVKARKVATASASVEIGVPGWADIATVRKFLQGTKALTFSFGGGEPYSVKGVEGSSNGRN